jgi:mannose-1-phosphate guanylyltransferase
MKLHVVILAGGSGTRFWPLSRASRPKQLMSVFGGDSMLQRTVSRVLPLAPVQVLVVTNAAQKDETERQVRQCAGTVPITVVAEPVGRNTAPAIGLAAAMVSAVDPAGLMLVLPADHFIADEDEFRATVLRGCHAAEERVLVTMGIVPTSPETGYGYIEAGGSGAGCARLVRRFVEKPPYEDALNYLASGSYYWNSGMFIWRADVIRQELRRYMPDLDSALAQVGAVAADNARLPELLAQAYAAIPSQSIDYGVLERSERVVVIPASFGWSDVGSWNALPEVLPADDSGNVVVAAAGTILIDAPDNILHAPDKMVALIGVKDLVVVDTKDALLVARRERCQEVRKVVDQLALRGLDSYL